MPFQPAAAAGMAVPDIEEIISGIVNRLPEPPDKIARQIGRAANVTQVERVIERAPVVKTGQRDAVRPAIQHPISGGDVGGGGPGGNQSGAAVERNGGWA